jgi:hypothetical protein
VRSAASGGAAVLGNLDRVPGVRQSFAGGVAVLEVPVMGSGMAAMRIGGVYADLFTLRAAAYR